MTENVIRMVSDDPMIPTAPLEEFIAAYEKDDNLWWSISCGHHQNLFEAAVEKIEQLQQTLRRVRLEVDDCIGIYGMDMQRPPHDVEEIGEILDEAGVGFLDGETERGWRKR